MRRRSPFIIGFALVSMTVVFLFGRNFQGREGAVNDVALPPGLSATPEETIPSSDQAAVQLPDSGGSNGQQSPTAGASLVSSLESPANIELSEGKTILPVLVERELRTETIRGQQVSYIKNQLILKMTRGATDQEIAEFLAKHNLKQVNNGRLKALRYISATIPDGTDVQRVSKAIAEDPQSVLLLKAVEPNYVANVMAIEDPLYSEQWYTGSVGFDKAWDIIKGTNHILVAVVDTGVESSHPDLVGRCVPGVNTIAEDQDATDEHGHGTSTAGLIAGAWNKVGIRGSCPANIEILPVKSLDASGQGTYEDAAEGIVAAADAGVRVVNLGFGGYGYSELLKDAVDYAVEKGCLVVAAGGNDGNDAVMYPAGYPDVMGVGALGRNGQIAPFSNRGPHIGIVAPGEDILSTSLNGAYKRASGSSCSAALASGMAALLLVEKPELSAYACAQAISSTAFDLGENGRDIVYGAGRIGALGALSSETKAFHDLAVVGISFESLVFDTAKPAQVLVMVRNNGTYSTETCSVVLYRIVDGQNVELGRETNFSISGTTTIPFEWTPALGESNVLFQAVVEADDDANLSNNGMTSRSFRIKSTGALYVLHAIHPPVHQWIAGEAYQVAKTVLPANAQTEFSTYGIPAQSTIIVEGHSVPGYSESYMIISGARHEDEEWWPGVAPYRNHFWDPDNPTALTGLAFETCLQRAQRRWQVAMASYSSGNMANAYDQLGHVVHLLSDMSVPAHVVGDQHAIWDTYEGGYLKEYNDRLSNRYNYQQWTSIGVNIAGGSALEVLFTNMAEIADQFDSNDASGEDSNHYEGHSRTWERQPQSDSLPGWYDVSYNDAHTHAQKCMPEAIRHVAALYKLFWDQTAQYRQIQVTVSASPAGQGLKVKVDGIEYTESRTFTWEKGTSHTIQAPSPQGSYVWGSWSDVGASQNSHTITPQVGGPYVATFVRATGVQLTGLSIAGPAVITENDSGQFTATAFYSDGSSQTVTPGWSDNSSATTISSSGRLSAGSVSADTVVTVSATYTAGGITKATSATVTIANAGSGGGSQTIHALVNGSFEAGTSPWDPGGYADVVALSYPHGGSRYAYLCDANSALGAIAQLFPVPAGTTVATLSFYLNIFSEETTTANQYDTMEVSLATSGDQYIGTVARFSNLNKGANGAYVLKSYNIMSLLSAYKGQSVLLVFTGTTDSGLKTIFRIDDVDVTFTVDNPVTLTGLSIRGPSSIPEGLGDSFWADAIFSDGTTQTISPNSWSETSSATTMSGGFLLAGQVSADTIVTVTASYTFNGVTKQATKNVTIVDSSAPAKTFSHLAVSGPSSINENSTGQFIAQAVFSDGTYQNVTPSWSDNSSATTISSSGLLNAGAVSGDTAVTVSATHTIGGVTRTGTKSVLILNLNPTPTLVSFSISGATTVNESSTAQYTGTAYYSDGSIADVSSSASWSENSAYSSINNGNLTTIAVSADQSCRITATYGGQTDTHDITINNVAATLSSLAISGSTAVNESSGAQYTCTAYYSDGSSANVSGSATWSENSSYSSINSSSGYLTTAAVTADQSCRITATYGGQSDTHDITIKNVTVNLPNLRPGLLPGAVDSIFVSTLIGAVEDSVGLTPTDMLYLNWAITNAGTASTEAPFDIAFYLDDEPVGQWTWPTALAPGRRVVSTNVEMGCLSQGIHTLTLKFDTFGAILESNEDDNEYTRTITISAPSTTLSVAPTSTYVPAAVSGGRQIFVTANMPWTATANHPWISIVSGSSSTGNGTITYNVAANGGAIRSGTITVSGGGASQTFTVNQWPASSHPLISTDGDFDGDFRADITVFHPATGNWYLSFSTSGGGSWVLPWGWSEVVPTPADCDGDGLVDIAVYHPAAGNWYILESSTGQRRIVQFGWSEAVPLPGDYDGDGKADLAVFHQAAGRWYFLCSTAGRYSVQWGWSTTIPVPADYDGDGKTDIAVYHPPSGLWQILKSSTGGSIQKQWGWSAALPVPADYDGDGKADVAVFHRATGMWRISYSGGGSRTKQFGWATTIPVAADYDGDGAADLAVYHPATGNWHILKSTTGETVVKNWGWSATKPTLLYPLIHSWFGLP